MSEPASRRSKTKRQPQQPVSSDLDGRRFKRRLSDQPPRQFPSGEVVDVDHNPSHYARPTVAWTLAGAPAHPQQHQHQLMLHQRHDQPYRVREQQLPQPPHSFPHVPAGHPPIDAVVTTAQGVAAHSGAGNSAAAKSAYAKRYVGRGTGALTSPPVTHGPTPGSPLSTPQLLNQHHLHHETARPASGLSPVHLVHAGAAPISGSPAFSQDNGHASTLGPVLPPIATSPSTQPVPASSSSSPGTVQSQVLTTPVYPTSPQNYSPAGQHALPQLRPIPFSNDSAGPLVESPPGTFVGFDASRYQRGQSVGSFEQFPPSFPQHASYSSADMPLVHTSGAFAASHPTLSPSGSAMHYGMSFANPGQSPSAQDTAYLPNSTHGSQFAQEESLVTNNMAGTHAAWENGAASVSAGSRSMVEPRPVAGFATSVGAPWLSNSESDGQHEGDDESGRGNAGDTGRSAAAPANDGKARRSRRPFSAEDRAKTHATRKARACVRCRMQKIRCEADPNDTTGTAPCDTCKSVSPDNPKTVHTLQCVRMKCSEIVLFRSGVGTGGLGLTNRWSSPLLVDVGDWVDNNVHTIEWSLGISDVPVTAQVRKFLPREGDATARYWVDGQGVRKWKELAPYALASITDTANSFQAYIEEHAIKYLWGTLVSQDADDLVKETYAWAGRHFKSLQHRDGNEPSKELAFLVNLFKLCFAIRHTMGSAWICGADKLGMEPVLNDESYPLGKKISLPRMVVAQWDLLNVTRILEPLRKTVLRELESMMCSLNRKSWFTVYVSVFILLHQMSNYFSNRYRHGKDNSTGARYSLPRVVEQMQYGSNVLLAHWNYFQRNVDPRAVTPEVNRATTMLAELSPEQFAFVVTSFDKIQTKRTDINRCWEMGIWEHELYWVASMYELGNWQPLPMYQS